MNWSEHIPLVSVLGAAFVAGVVSLQIRLLAKDVKRLVEVTVPRLHARLDEEKEWRTRLDERLKVQAEERAHRARTVTRAHGTRVPPEDETPP